MNYKHWLSVGASAFATGAGTWAAQHLATAQLGTLQGVEGFAIGALLGGAAALAHLFQPPPAAS